MEAKEPMSCSDNSGKETSNLELELRTILIVSNEKVISSVWARLSVAPISFVPLCLY